MISPGFKRNLLEKGVSADRVDVIPNWADEATFAPVARQPSMKEALNLPDGFRVMYAGNLGAAQALGTVLDAAQQLSGHPQIQFVLVGSGVDEAALKARVRDEGIHNVHLVGRQPISMMASVLAWADVLLIHLRRDPLFSITIPSKTMAYLACGRPIICAVEGDAADLITGSGAGVSCSPESPGALTHAVLQMAALSSDEREEMAMAAVGTHRERFTRKVLVERYERVFSDLVRDLPHSPPA